MQRLIMIMIVVATTFDFLSKGDGWGRFALLPREAGYLSELLGAIALLYVVVAGTRNRFQFVRPTYWFAFGTLLFVMAAGIVLNHVEPGPIFAGLRTYLRAIPWFFVGAVVAFTEQDLRKQFRLLVAIALVQLPLAIEQRMHGFGGGTGSVVYTGDSTTGTLIISSVLSIFLICGMCMLVAFYVRGRLTTRQFVLLFPVLLTPTLINETKGTLVLLPIGLIATYLAASDPQRRIRALLTATSLTLLVGMVFVPVYNHFRSETQPGIEEFLTDPAEAERYLQRDVVIGSQSEKPAGRVDSVLVPLRELASDPSRLAFGYGVGNVSDSRLGIHFVGEYYPKFSLFLTIAFARISLELGVVGLTIVLYLMWSVYSDALKVARRDRGIFGAIASGMAGATAIIVICIFYKDLTGQMSMSFLFWYTAGLISAQRMRIAASARHPAGARMIEPISA